MPETYRDVLAEKQGGHDLEIMLEVCRRFNHALPSDFRQIQTDADRVEWIERFTIAAQAELFEVRSEIPWKWWGPSHDTNWENVKTELMDVLSFVLNMCLVLDMSAEEISRRHEDKMNVSWRRRADCDDLPLLLERDDS